MSEIQLPEDKRREDASRVAHAMNPRTLEAVEKSARSGRCPNVAAIERRLPWTTKFVGQRTVTTSPATTPTVYVIDDDASIRESLSSLIRAEGMIAKVFESPLEFLAAKELDDFACIVLDVQMPGLDGLALQERLAQRGTDLPIVFITGNANVPDAVRAMKGGAIDFLRKPFEGFELLDAITAALSRVSASFDDKLKTAELMERYEHLTPREKEIMFLVAQGKQNKIIACELGVTESTVKVHRHNVMSKMQMRSLPELTIAIQRLNRS